jgi:hypothetical protein
MNRVSIKGIEHAPHYGGGDNPYEAIKVIEVWRGRDSALEFCLGNVLKYLCRGGRKPGVPLHDDLKKARDYLTMAIDNLDRARDEDEAIEIGG